MDVDTCYDMEMEVGNETDAGIGMNTNNGNHGVSNNRLEVGNGLDLVVGSMSELCMDVETYMTKNTM